MSRLLGFGTALPAHRIGPDEGLRFLRRFFPRLRGVEAQRITRYTAKPMDEMIRHRSLTETMGIYAEHASSLAAQAVERALAAAGVRPEQVDLVIGVSCTGYLVPSLDVGLINALGMRPDVIRLPITELGCSGGLGALAAAHRHLEGRPQDTVLVVAVELCSLSFRPGDHSVDNLAASLVFGDGAAAAVLGGGMPEGGGSGMLATGTHLIPGTSGLLGFDLRDGGFHVVLASRLGRVIEAHLAAAVNSFRERHGMDEPSFYAVHAGGPRIFDAVDAALGLHPDALAASRRLFEDVGNLSSASILFALARLEGVSGDGMAIAFGPGVSVELAWVRRCRG
jgi:alkylresorcinol/alkylpyrone synthase